MKKNVFSFATSSFGYGISKVMDINGSNIKKIKIGTFVDDLQILYNHAQRLLLSSKNE